MDGPFFRPYELILRQDESIPIYYNKKCNRHTHNMKTLATMHFLRMHPCPLQ